jgi:tetratricopeptide (TPR) repeat protein
MAVKKSGQIMVGRFFQLIVALGVLWVTPIAPALAHGGGGGGGGGGSHGGYGGGGAHFGGASGSSHFSGSSSHFSSNSPNLSGSSSHFSGNNFSHSGYVHGESWGHNNWDHYFNHGYWGPGWGWGASWGWGYPYGFGYWGDYPFGWGGYWGDYFYPYGRDYADAYPMAAYCYAYPDDGQYAVNYRSAPIPALVADEPNSAGESGATANEGLQFYNEARASFTRGDYRNALRLAEHSAVESPQNVKVHELTSLALFASGEYRGAATAAHGALALGAPSDWSNLFSYYNDADKYTEQLRKLEKSVTDAPTSAAGQFLLGYHYLMTGAKAEAKAHFILAAKLTPNDKLAQHIVKQLETNGSVTPPVLPKPPEAQKGKQL